MNVDECAAAALSSLDPETRGLLATDPIEGLRALGLSVQAMDRLNDTRHDGGACDGVSFLREGLILYASSPNSRRENFTLGHELGHYLVDQNATIMNWLGDQPEAMAQLETICDRIASGLLLSQDDVDLVIQGRPITAAYVLDLYANSKASRPACAIAVADRMRGLGAVAIINADTRVVGSSSVHPDPDLGWPEVFPWRGQPVPSGHPLLALKAGGSMRRRSYWANAWGAQQRYYIDAHHDGRRLVAVFADTDIWGCETLHLDPEREYLNTPAGQVCCCGATHHVRGYPCPTCRKHYCPSCKQCPCEKSAARESTCSRCFLSYQPHLLIRGLCEECR